MPGEPVNVVPIAVEYAGRRQSVTRSLCLAQGWQGEFRNDYIALVLKYGRTAQETPRPEPERCRYGCSASRTNLPGRSKGGTHRQHILRLPLLRAAVQLRYCCRLQLQKRAEEVRPITARSGRVIPPQARAAHST